jgi:signal transduction histidine kinase
LPLDPGEARDIAEAEARHTPITAAGPIVGDAISDERVLAWVRLGSATALLLRLVTDTGPGHSVSVTALTAGYVAYAFLVLFASYRYADWLIVRVVVAHRIDFVWTAAAATVGGGAGSHPFSLFAFVVAAAAFRWGLRRAVVNALLVLVVGLLQDIAAGVKLNPWALEADHFLEQVSYLTSGMAVLFGVLADRLHRARRNLSAIAALVAAITRARSAREAMSTILRGVAEIMQSPNVLAVTEDTYTGGVTVWRARRDGDGTTVTDEDVARGRARDWLNAGQGGLPACDFRRRHPREDPELRVLPGSTTPGAPSDYRLPSGVLATAEWRRLWVVPFSASDAWTGQLYVMDARAVPRGSAQLRLLTEIVRQASPPLLNLQLLRRLRYRAEAAERSRISRNLHDTANQSLATVSLRLGLLAHQLLAESSDRAADVLEIAAMVRALDLDLRESVSEPPPDLDAEGLPAALGAMVDRFSHQAGIDASLDWSVGSLRLPPQHCAEVARIVQEALVNVRRHSGANRVTVVARATDRGWVLIIQDNGRGLGFAGRLSGKALLFKGPRVIRERATALGAALTVDSSDSGTRLELTFSESELD